MKKIVALSVILTSILGFSTQSFAGGEYASDAAKIAYPYYNGLTLESMLEASKSSTTDKILSDNFDQIINNSLYEDWQYDSTHFATKAMDYNIFVPTKLQSKVKSIDIKLSTENYNQVYPMYDSMGSLGVSEDAKTETSNGIPVEVSIENKNYEGEYLTGQIIIERKEFEVQNDYGASYQGQVYLILTDGSEIPYSQLGYIYVNPMTVDGIKSDLSNAYYNTQTDYYYVDVTNLLQAAFKKVEEKTKNNDEYVAVLEKVLEKAKAKLEEITNLQDEIATKVTDEESFNAAISVYGDSLKKSDILNSAVYQIQTEIGTKKGSSVIDELFE